MTIDAGMAQDLRGTTRRLHRRGHDRFALPAAGYAREVVAVWGATLLRRASSLVLASVWRRGVRSPEVRSPVRPDRPARSGGARGVTTLRWVRPAWQAAWESLSVTSYLVPLLVAALPWGCGAAVPPLRTRSGVSPARTRRPGRSVSDVDALAVIGRPARSPAAHRRARRVPAWVDRSVVRLCRVSALRNARATHAFVIPSRAWPPSHALTGDPPPPPAGRVKEVPTTLVARGERMTSVAPRASHAAEHPRFPIDVVYTWVDDQDPVWRARYAEALKAWQRDGCDAEAAGSARFHNRDELRYSLRSLAAHAPFVRRVFIVTAGQVPPWLDVDAPGLRLVPHEEVLGPDCLPTFNSHAIESALHRINGLAEHYLYLNDDFFFGRECNPSTFFTPDGQPKLFPDPRAMVPDGPCSPADRPVDSASKNTREIMYAEFDFLVRHKMKHAPYPQRRSVLDEMEQRFPWVFKQTARNAFRHHTDVNIPSCLSHYYAFVTGAAVPGRVPASYINIGSPWAQLQMHRLLQRADRDVFCLNDCPMSAKRRVLVDAGVRAFLGEYFPDPSPFELDR